MNSFGATSTLTDQPCNTGKVVENFSTLLNELDFSQQLKILNIGKLNIRKKNLAYQDMLALSIVLWRLALQSTFPSDYEHIFELYLTKRREQAISKKEQVKQLRFQLIIRAYVDLLETQGNSNFTEISSYLIKKIKPSSSNYESIRLKLALSIRNIYSFFFQRLI